MCYSIIRCFSHSVSVITGIQDLLMVCKNERTIGEKRELLRSWVSGDPTSILKKAKRMNTATPLSEYLEDLGSLIKSKFKRGCSPENRSLERERVIVRYVVYVQLQMMDRFPSKKSPLVSHRNQETPIEVSVRQRTDDPVQHGPSTTVVRQLQTATSFLKTHPEQLPTPTATTTGPLLAAPVLPNPTPEDTDWSTAKVASLHETRKYNHCLILRAPYCDIHLYHHPVEVYIAWRLHETRHVYENLGLASSSLPPPQHQGSSVFIISDEGATERYPQTFMVARPGSSIFDESFPSTVYAIPIGKLLAFIVRHGKADSSRSNGHRLDISNGGQAQDVDADEFRPKTLCGDKVFLLHEDGELVRAVIGMYVDGICRAIKRMCRDMGMPHCLNHKRFLEYGDKMRAFLFAKESFVESITLQLLDITAGETGVEHEDISNDPRASYDVTCAHVMMLECAGRLMSLKILCSFRKKIGDFYSAPMSKINRLLVNGRTMLAEVNNSYSRLISHHKGSYRPTQIPTWDNVEPLFLDEGSPFIKKTLAGTNIEQEVLVTLTGVNRGLWMASALSSIYELAENYSERGMVQMLMIMSWQNSFTRFWEVCRRMPKTRSKYPIYDYQRIAYKLFYVEGKERGNEMIGGEDPRFGPIGFDFNEVFGTHNNPKFEIVDAVVDSLLSLCDRVNLVIRPSQCETGDAAILKLLSEASQQVGAVAKCELGSFRLMLFLQGCGYLRVRLEPGEYLRRMFYPVKGSGSWNHVKEQHVEDKDVGMVCLEVQKELSTPRRKVWMDEVEVILCESKEGRLLQKFDTFIKGTSLFRFDNVGECWIKRFGEYVWMRYRVRHRTTEDP